jgi:hypothetical protein
MPPPSPNEIKAQIAALLTPVIATSTTKKAKIIDHLAWAFREGSGEDPTNLRSELDPVALIEGGGVIDRINCLMISDESFSQSLPEPPSDPRITMPRGRAIVTRRFRLTYFYQFSEGSELTFSENVEVIRRTLNSNPRLGFAAMVGMNPGPAQFIDGHTGLQVSAMFPDAFGVLVHVMLGTLEVRVIEPLEVA